MSRNLVICPNCEQEVPEGRYCNICGHELPVSSPPPPPMAPAEEEASWEVPSEDTSFEMPRFDVTVEDMPGEAVAILLSRAELEVIDGELDRIIDQTRATRQALQLKEADREVLTKRAEELKTEFERLRERKQDLSRVRAVLRLEQLLDDFDHHEERLRKLKEIGGSVDKDVFEEQRSEIIQNLKSLRSGLKSAVKEARKWNKSMRKTEKVLQKELSRLDAKHKIGDISRTAYEASVYQTKRSMKLLEGGAKRLDELLERAGSK
jgi:DNA repair exonuclease SbcCD ATPase subunit